MRYGKWFLGLLFLLIGVTGSDAATRLGLLVTQEELNIWRQRMTDNVTTINGFTYQTIYQNRILNDANDFRSNQPHPGGDGFWEGYTGAGCKPATQTPRPGSGYAGRYGRGNGAMMARSALVYLLTGDVSYATPVKIELVNQASPTATPGTDWTNTSKWCFDQLGGESFLEIVPWVYRVLLTYDLLKAAGYTGWTTAEEDSIRAWLLAGARGWDGRLVSSGQTSSYPGMFNTPQDLTGPVGGPGFQSDNLWFGGPQLWEKTYYPWYNQPANVMGLSMAAGILFNDAALKLHAHRFWTGFLTAGTYNSGANPDYVRWHDCTPGCPGAMWGHAMSPTGWMILVADLLARTGDTSLYTMAVTSQVYAEGGQTVNFEKVLTLWADMVNGAVTLYGTTASNDLVPARVLTWNSDIDPGNPSFVNTGNYYDLASMAANLFYKNTAVHTAMSRNAIGSNSNVGFVGCNDSQMGGCFVGTYVFWPDLPFMYGNMENQVYPYSLATSAPPALTISAPTNQPTYSTTLTPLTSLSGTATDDTGVTSVTWTCPSCTPTSGTATCASCGATAQAVTWNVPTMGLASGDNVITVTAHDGEAQTGLDILTVMLTAPPSAATILRLGP